MGVQQYGMLVPLMKGRSYERLFIYKSNQGVQQWRGFQHVTTKFFIFHNLSVFISKPKIHENCYKA